MMNGLMKIASTSDSGHVLFGLFKDVLVSPCWLEQSSRGIPADISPTFHGGIWRTRYLLYSSGG